MIEYLRNELQKREDRNNEYMKEYNARCIQHTEPLYQDYHYNIRRELLN